VLRPFDRPRNLGARPTNRCSEHLWRTPARTCTSSDSSRRLDESTVEVHLRSGTANSPERRVADLLAHCELARLGLPLEVKAVPPRRAVRLDGDRAGCHEPRRLRRGPEIDSTYTPRSRVEGAKLRADAEPACPVAGFMPPTGLARTTTGLRRPATSAAESVGRGTAQGPR